jgi:hypothetical protein
MWDSAAPANAQVRRVETGSATGAAVLAGLDPSRLDRVARASAFARIGSTAGNAAVAGLVSRVRTNMPLDPPEGVREIRRVGGGGTLGHTRALMDPSPPLFRLPSPTAADGAYAVRPGRTRAPELDFEVRYPTRGRHVLYEGTTSAGARANIYLEVSPEWSRTILTGEEEHVGDQTIAWQDTWGRVAEVVNAMATEAPVTAATPEEAQRTAWRTFVGRLPGPLRPDGADASESAQLAKWDVTSSTSIFKKLVGESKRARDISQWHTPDSSLDHMEGENEVRVLAAGSSQIGVTTPEVLMREAWARLSQAAGGAAARGGGSRRR